MKIITSIVEINGEHFVMIPNKIWHGAGFPEDLKEVELTVKKGKIIITVPKRKPENS